MIIHACSDKDLVCMSNIVCPSSCILKILTALLFVCVYVTKGIVFNICSISCGNMFLNSVFHKSIIGFHGVVSLYIVLTQKSVL